MALKALPSLAQFESAIFAQPRVRGNCGQKIHQPDLFPIQVSLWETILNQVNPITAERIHDLLPNSPVTEKEHAALYQQYDCVGFAFYVLGNAFLDDVVETQYKNSVILTPNPKIIWEDFWETTELEKYGLKKVPKPDQKYPTLVVFTVEHPDWEYTQPAHFAIHLGNFDGKMWLAQKPGPMYLPDLVPLQQIKNVYKGTPGEYNAKDPGIEYWELRK